MSYPVSKIVQIQISLAAAGLSPANFAKGVFFVPLNESPEEKRGSYEVVGSNDWGTMFEATTETYKALTSFFGGIPEPEELILWYPSEQDNGVSGTLDSAWDQIGWWFWTFFDAPTMADTAKCEQIAAWCESKKAFFANFQVGSNAADIRNPAKSDDLLSKLKASGFRYHACGTSEAVTAAGVEPYGFMKLAKWFMKVNYNGTNSTIRANYQKLAGLQAENLDGTKRSALEAKGGWWYGTAELQGSSDVGRVFNAKTTSAYNENIQDVVNLAAFENALSVALYNVVTDNVNYARQDVAGQQQVLNAAARIGNQYINNGFLGERSYISNETGESVTTIGYEINGKAEDILKLTDEQRASALCAPFSITIYRKGFIEKAPVQINVI